MGQEYLRQILVLGSVPALGPVDMYDDMEGTFKWSKAGTGGDDVLEKSITVAYNASASMHAKTRTTTATDGDYIDAKRRVYARASKRYRIELIWKFTTLAANKEFFTQLVVEDGAYAHAVGLKFLPNSAKWQYQNVAGTFSDVPGGAQSLAADNWHRLLFEFDQSTGKMVTMVSDSLNLDLSDLSYYKSAHVVAEESILAIRAIAHTSPPAEIYVDDVLILEV